MRRGDPQSPSRCMASKLPQSPEPAKGLQVARYGYRIRPNLPHHLSLSVDRL